MTIFGYARVSTAGQDLTAQTEKLKAAGATTIFREKISGVKANRPQLTKLMTALKAGDTIIVCKLDRLGRSTRELLELIDRIGKAGAVFRSLGDPARLRPDFVDLRVVEDDRADAILLLQHPPRRQRRSLGGSDRFQVSLRTEKHRASLVYDQQDAAFPLLGVDTGMRLARADGNLPIDATDVIARQVTPDLFEIEPSAAQARGMPTRE